MNVLRQGRGTECWEFIQHLLIHADFESVAAAVEPKVPEEVTEALLSGPSLPSWQ
jgi:hypothetical protein